jgi:alpha-L-fucosidase 2
MRFRWATQPKRSFDDLLAEHIKDYQGLLNRLTLDVGVTGWSKAWKICIWARLQEGERAYKLLGEFIKNNVYPNLWGYHPPFQIDCNFGYAAGVCEMLVQSHMGVVDLLPALPKAWPAGTVRGLRVRGGFEVDIEWQDGKLVQAVVKGLSNEPGLCSARYRKGACTFSLAKGESRVLQAGDFRQ